MSEVVGEGVVHIRTDDTGVNVTGAGQKAGAGYTKGFLGSMGKLAVGIGSVLAAREVLSFAKDALAEGREAQKVGAATEQIIKTTGSTANVTAQQVGDLATALSTKVGVDDEAIQSGANLVLTFKNIKNAGDGANAIFDRTVAATQDVAAAGFGSIESASKGLGKALNDPLKGITALGRAGITFTDAQKEQIKALVESGDLLSAQKIILGEVEGQVGGVAEATATSSEKAQVAWGNLKEQIGTALIPTVDRLADTFTTRVVPAISDLIAGTSPLTPWLRGIADVVGSVVDVVGGGLHDLVNGVTVFRRVLSGEGGSLDSNGPFVKLGLVLGDLVKGILPEASRFFREDLMPGIQQAADVAREFAAEVLPVMANTFKTEVLPALTALGGYLIENVLPILSDLAGIVVKDVVPTLASLAVLLYGTVYPALIEIVTAVATQLKPVFDQLLETFRADVLPTLQSLVQTIRNDLIPALQPVVEKVLGIVGAVLKLAAAILAKVLPPLIQFAGFLIRNLVPFIAAVIVKVVQFVGAILSVGEGIGRAIGRLVGFAKSVAEFQAKIVGFLLDVPGKVLDLVGDMKDAGKRFMGGLFDGIVAAAGKAGGVVADIATSIRDEVVGLINDAIDLINDGIPNSIGKGPLTIDLPNNPIPHLARGTSNWPGGWSWVGEQGPELVNVPRGAQVVPAGRSAAMAAAATGGPEIVIEHQTVMPHNYSEFVRSQEADARLAGLGNRRPGSVRPVYAT